MLPSLIKEATFQTNHIYQLGAFNCKGYPNIDFTNEPVFQYDFPLLGNTFGDDCK